MFLIPFCRQNFSAYFMYKIFKNQFMTKKVITTKQIFSIFYTLLRKKKKLKSAIKKKVLNLISPKWHWTETILLSTRCKNQIKSSLKKKIKFRSKSKISRQVYMNNKVNNKYKNCKFLKKKIKLYNTYICFKALLKS